MEEDVNSSFDKDIFNDIFSLSGLISFANTVYIEQRGR